MKKIKNLSHTLSITLLFQLLFIISCDTTSSSTSLTINNLSPLISTIEPTESLSFSIGVEGATSTDIRYHWQINDEAATETYINTYTFGPRSEGTYSLKVWATEGSKVSNTLAAAIKVEEEVIVIDKPKITAVLDKKYMSDLGNVTATIQTTKDGWTYYFKLGNESEQSSSSNSKTFSISSTGNYTVQMWVIDGNNQKSNVVSIELIVGSFPIHTDIVASTFWCGEGATSDNNFITNTTSAWDIHWGANFGLEDKPTGISRNSEHIPTSSKFTGNENPYYFALPYNDMGNLVYDGIGTKIENAVMGAYGRKQSAYDKVYWANEKTPSEWGGLTSMCKNRWIRVKIRWTTTWCYAQWEDAGPYYYEDYNYVFGEEDQLNDNNSPYAGIDLSPSVWLYLGKTLEWWGAAGNVDWQFVDESDVPDGPWKRHVTTKQIDWTK